MNKLNSKKEKVVILGENIDKKNYPKLYHWAKKNPKELERQIKSLLKTGGSVHQNLANLESDLQHG